MDATRNDILALLGKPKKAKTPGKTAKPAKSRRANAYHKSQFRADKTYTFYHAEVLATIARTVGYEADEVPEIICL